VTLEELRQLVADMQRRRSELDNVEVKAAPGGTPKRLYESLSAFANRTGGGVLLFGLDEGKDFSIVGVGNAQRLQEELTHLASAEMEPALRPQFILDEINGETVIAVEIEEIAANQKPCFYRPAGLSSGAYIRSGNTNRQMTEYEVFGYLSSRGQPKHDEDLVANAALTDLDSALIEKYLSQLQSARPKAGYLDGSQEEVLTRLHVCGRDGDVVRPTLAGLLMFGKYPQEFFPQLMITFLQYYGTTEEEHTPRGERFMDNQRFEGPIPEMVERTESYVLGAMRKASLIEGTFRRDIPEYPQDALREAIANAVAHRDYSPYVRGSYIQIRMFADRLEVQSPGGLFGNVTVENLEEEHSTRNARLMRMMEDWHIVENRGSGIKAMLQAMRTANLEPPPFADRRASFLVTFRSHTMMGPQAIAWLNQFAGQALEDRQRLALVYLRDNEQMTNSDYRRLNHVDSVTANRELRGLVQAGLVEQNGTRRWAYYSLTIPHEAKFLSHPQTDEERILAYVWERGSIKRSDCQQLLGISPIQARYVLQRMREKGLLRLQGSRKGARYLAGTL
jgi:ATP-dependent DNA helicase RecG